MNKTIALERQIRNVKDKYPNALVLFAVGEFYEVFNEDATKLGDLLGLKTVSNERWTLLGFPKKRLTNYLPKLIKEGYKVAIVNDVVVPNPLKNSETVSFKQQNTTMKTKTKKSTKTKSKTSTKRKATASAKAFGKKAKRTNELAFTKAYLDGKSGKRIRTPKAYLKEAAARVWK